jgi:propionyl-CoA synthetase
MLEIAPPQPCALRRARLAETRTRLEDLSPMPGSYRAVYEAAMRDPEGFWLRAADAIDWVVPPRRAFDPAAGVYGRWFPDATCNTCYNAVDRHVRVRPGQPAIIHDSPMTGTRRTISYHDLHRQVQAMAAVLAAEGVTKGDRVIVYMPMIPETLVVMLACARLGAIHSVVFGGFAANELAARIDDAAPKLVVAASCGVEPGRCVAYKPLVDGALRLASHRPQAVLCWQRPELCAELNPDCDKDLTKLFGEALAAGRSNECVAVAAS